MVSREDLRERYAYVANLEKRLEVPIQSNMIEVGCERGGVITWTLSNYFRYVFLQVRYMYRFLSVLASGNELFDLRIRGLTDKL